MALFGGINLPGHPDLENARRLDLLTIPPLRRMMRLGMAIDREYLWELGSNFSTQMVEIAKDITSYVPIEHIDQFIDAELASESGEDDSDTESAVSLNPASSDQIGKLLFDILDVGADKRDKLKRTKGGDRYSTGKRQLETLRYDHPVIPRILQYREVAKLKSTYCYSLPAVARFHPHGDCCPVCELHHDEDQWRVHGEIGTTRAATWRFNHKNPNLANVPVRSDNGQLVLAGFIAPNGKVLLWRDLSQIELRCLAHLANCQSMIDVYEQDGDIHDDTCHRALGVPWDEKPDKVRHRMAAKRCNFGIMNGSTEKGLYLQLVTDFGLNSIPIPDWLTEPWCKEFIEAWLDSRPEVRDYFELQWYRGRRYSQVWNSFGFCRPVPEIRSTHSWIREAGLRQAQNMPITSLAAGQMKLSMARCEYMFEQAEWYEDNGHGPTAWPLVTIHDAMGWEVDENQVDEVSGVTAWAFDGCMDDEETGERMFRVPVKSDADIATRWVK